MLGGACVIGWRLDAQRHGEIRAKLEARDAALEDEGLLGEALALRPSLDPEIAS